MNYNQCHVEYTNNMWGIYWPDNSPAWNQKFKSKSWATRTLNWLIQNNG